MPKHSQEVCHCPAYNFPHRKGSKECRLLEEEASYPQECYHCRGTGEGSHDGARCWACKGTGIRSVKDQ